MRSLLTAGLVAGLALASPACSARPTRTSGLRRPRRWSPPSTAPTITLGHVIAMRDRLPPQYQNLPDDVLMTGLVDQLVDQELLAEAQSASPESDPLQVKLAVENERRGALAGIAAERRGGRRGRRRQGAGGLRQAGRGLQAGARVQRRAHPRRQRGQGQGAEGRDRRRQGLRRGRQGELQRRLGRERRRSRLVRRRPDGAGVRDRGGRRCRSAQVSEPVKSQFGWHLIKLNEQARDHPAGARRRRAPEIENQLRQAALRGEARRAARRGEDREAGDRARRPRRSARATF